MAIVTVLGPLTFVSLESINEFRRVSNRYYLEDCNPVFAGNLTCIVVGNEETGELPCIVQESMLLLREGRFFEFQTQCLGLTLCLSGEIIIHLSLDPV